MKSITVYCGSSDQVQEKFLESAREMGKQLSARGMRLIYGGGSTGLMGALADSVLAEGGEAVGVITEHLNKDNLVHSKLTRLEVVGDMHQRKARMIELADGFIALPGGFGTLEEFFEALTWAQLGLHHKAIGLLNVDGYYDALLAFLAHTRKEGFSFKEHQGLYTHAEQADELIDKLAAHKSPNDLGDWLDR